MSSLQGVVVPGKVLCVGLGYQPRVALILGVSEVLMNISVDTLRLATSEVYSDTTGVALLDIKSTLCNRGVCKLVGEVLVSSGTYVEVSDALLKKYIRNYLKSI